MSSRLLRLPLPVPASPSAPSTSCTYASRSSHLKRSGLRASTICTTRCDRSRTRQSCRQTSILRSNGVRRNLSRSCSLLARGTARRRGSRNYETGDVLSKSSSPFQESILLLPVQLCSSHRFRPWWSPGNTQALLILAMFPKSALLLFFREEVWIVLCSSSSNDLDVSPLYVQVSMLPYETNKGVLVPAVKFVPASVAVFRNSSRSRSCVMDCSRVVASISVVYYEIHMKRHLWVRPRETH